MQKLLAALFAAVLALSATACVVAEDDNPDQVEVEGGGDAGGEGGGEDAEADAEADAEVEVTS